MHQHAPRCFSHVLERQCQRGVRAERRDPGQHVVERHTQRVKVAAMIDRVTLCLLGTDVERCSHGDARLGHVGVPAFLVAAEAKVGDFHLPLACHQDVLGLDVAVDQPNLAGRPDRLRRSAA